MKAFTEISMGVFAFCVLGWFAAWTFRACESADYENCIYAAKDAAACAKVRP